MPWLVVLGSGSWTCGRTKYTPGKYEVGDDVVAAVLRSRLPNVLLLEEEPEMRFDGPSDGPLSLDDITRKHKGMQLRLPDADPEEEPEIRPRDEHPCLFCPLGFPSRPALLRHVEMHHKVLHP